MGFARQHFSQAGLLERALKTQLTKQVSLLGKGSPQVNGLPYFRFRELAGVTLMQWEHMRPTSQSLAAGELGKAGVLCGVESPADLPQVDFPWMAGSESQSWLCGWLHGRLCGLEFLARRSWGWAGRGGSPFTASLVEQAEDTGPIGSSTVSPLQWVK